jgi:hypothetical protein
MVVVVVGQPSAAQLLNLAVVGAGQLLQVVASGRLTRRSGAWLQVPRSASLKSVLVGVGPLAAGCKLK